MNLSYRTKANATFMAKLWGKPLDKKDWFKINAEVGEEVEILIYDIIGWPWLDANLLVSAMAEYKGRPINFAINSPGGDLVDAIAIYQAMQRHDAKITTRIDSLAASSASVLAMGGEEVSAYKSSTFMMHNPWLMTIGNEFAHAEAIDILKQYGTILVGLYSEKAKVGKREIKSLMNGTDKRDGTWLTANEAKEKGFVDSIIEGRTGKLKNHFNLSVFAGAPGMSGGGGDVTVREAEKILRDAGISNKRAKELLAGCLNPEPSPDDGRRDVGNQAEMDEILSMIQSIKA